jgi:phage gpG-like protein
MTPEEFVKQIRAQRRQLDTMMRRKMPVIAGRMAKDHYQDNFRQSGFVNGGLHPWPAVRRQSAGTRAANRYGPLLSGRNHLFSSINYYPDDYRVRVADEVVYAPVHNWGETLNPTVTAKMKRYAWYRYYSAIGKKKDDSASSTSGKRKKSSKKKVNTEEAEFWKGMALTRKSKLTVKVPQRQFIGESAELTQKINQRMETEIRNILNK